MKKYLLVGCLALLLSTLCAQDDQKKYPEAFEVIEAWLEAQKDYEQLPGLSAIAVDDQEVLWSGAVGLANKEENVKTRVSTICSICSISKLFTAVAIMKLYDEGKLRLDDEVGFLLSDYNLRQQYPGSGPITVRSLLTHSSGLPREADYPYWTAPDFPFPSRQEIYAKLGEQKTLYPASTYYQYSNLALSLLGDIVEEISGVPFETYVQTNILDPLGLSDTRTELPEEMYGDALAIGYSAIMRDGARDKVNFFQANGIMAAAGFSSNVEDLAKFASWQFRLRDTAITEILRSSTLRNMHNVHWTDPGWEITRGLGFWVDQGSEGDTWVGHNGSCPGYRSTLRLNLNDKRAYAVMINASGTNPAKYANGIHAILAKVEEINDADETDDVADLQQYAGYYSTWPWWGEMFVTPWNGKLAMIDLPTDDPGKSLTFYRHVQGDVFQRIRDDDEPGEPVTFVRDDSGRIIHVKSHENNWVKIER